ncbi:MAG: hypothetical protein NW217_15035 [Hyphomicrobiaceae bacterium]|nr:hypothetical protein [Hyphomicrobiaceae bacterium]
MADMGARGAESGVASWRAGHFARLAAGLALFVHVGAVRPVAAQPLPPDCASRIDGPFSVVQVGGFGELELNDGRVVRLTGVEPPVALVATASLNDAEQATTEINDLIRQRVSGQPVFLHRRGDARDRYGRIPAQVRIGGAVEGEWLQATLVTAGLVQAAAELGGVIRADAERASGAPGKSADAEWASEAPGQRTDVERASEAPGQRADVERASQAQSTSVCLLRLVEHEAEARSARRGGWATGAFAVLAATDLESLEARSGTHQVVEGRIARVSRYGRSIYLNFGRRWTQDFTVVIAGAVLRRNAAWAAALVAMKGRRVRVRGFLVQSGGPRLDIEDPAALELIEPAR